MAKLGATRPYLRDKTTGKKIWKPKPRSLMSAQTNARAIAKKTGHVIEVVDDFGVYSTHQPPQQNPKRRVLVPAKVEITPSGKMLVFVSANVARRLKSNPGGKRITKEQWTKAGGLSNPKLTRVQRGGKWYYYQLY